MTNHGVYHHIENGGRRWVALGNPYLSAEGCSILPSRPRNHIQPHPILLEEANGPGPHVTTLQDTHASGPVQGIVSLVQVQDDRTEDHLPQGRNLMNQLDLKGGGTHTANRPESVEEFVVGDGGGEAAIDNHRH